MRQGEQCVRLAGAAPLAGECGPPVRPMDGQAAVIFVVLAVLLALMLGMIERWMRRCADGR